MSEIHVFGGRRLDPSAVGRVSFELEFRSQFRIARTAVFEAGTGKRLLSATTAVPLTRDDQERALLERDSYEHGEIIASITQRRDAVPWSYRTDQQGATRVRTGPDEPPEGSYNLCMPSTVIEADHA